MPNFLVMDSETSGNGGASRMFLYTNGSPTQIGNDFGSSRSSAANTEDSQNRLEAIQFGGELYGVAQDGIYQKDDPTSMTGPWTSVITFTNPLSAAFQSCSWGIHAIEIGGVMNLVSLHADASFGANYRWVRFDGTSWTQAASPTIALTGPAIMDVIVYHNVLYMAGGNGSSIAIASYDPTTDVSTLIPDAIGNTMFGVTFCVFDDRLFALAMNVGSNATILCEFVGGSFIQVASMGSTDFGVVSGKWGLFSDGTTMTAMFTTSTGGDGWRCIEFDSALAQTDLTAIVLPTSLRYTGAAGGAFAGASLNERMIPVYDVNSVVGVTDIYLFQSGINFGSYTVYKWNGNAALMTVVDSGGNSRHSLPSNFPSFGERIFTAGELDIKIVGRVGVPGGEQISFTVTGGGTSRKMKLHYAQGGTPPVLEATLALPVTGGSATFNGGSNQVEGIDADGVTVYTIVWTPGPDGLSAADRVFRVPEALI